MYAFHVFSHPSSQLFPFLSFSNPIYPPPSFSLSFFGIISIKMYPYNSSSALKMYPYNSFLFCLPVAIALCLSASSRFLRLSLESSPSIFPWNVHVLWSCLFRAGCFLLCELLSGLLLSLISGNTCIVVNAYLPIKDHSSQFQTSMINSLWTSPLSVPKTC
jgi:hypothetical protein